MDEWLQQLQANLDKAAKDSGQWLAKAVEGAVEETDMVISHTLDDVAKAISPVVEEVNHYVDSGLDATEIFVYQHLTPFIEEATAPINNTVTPYFQSHRACIGCKHYNGSEFGGNMLVCGMHPYGPEEPNCQDWESVWLRKEESSKEESSKE